MVIPIDLNALHQGLGAFVNIENNTNLGIVINRLRAHFDIFISAVAIQSLQILCALTQ
jgi:hypothetical protein